MRRQQQESAPLKRTRESASDYAVEDSEADDAHHGPSKKRRISKNLDRKYACPHEGCGKAYSRAEHLYRHQLNHAPKQIYRCDFVGCERTFVRQDLCARHRDRHTKANSHISRKDAVKASKNSIVSPDSSSAAEKVQPDPMSGQRHDAIFSTTKPSDSDDSDTHISKSTEHAEPPTLNQPPQFPENVLDPRLASRTPAPQATQAYVLHSHHTNISRSSTIVNSALNDTTSFSFGGVKENIAVNPKHPMRPPPHEHDLPDVVFARPHRLSMPRNTQAPHLMGSLSAQHPMNPAYPVQQPGAAGDFMLSQGQTTSSSATSPARAGATPSLPPFGYPFINAHYTSAIRSDSVTSFASKSTAVDNIQATVTSRDGHFEDAALMDHLPSAMTMPVFSQETLNHVQFGMGDEFMGWLFSDDQHQILQSPLSQAQLHQSFRPPSVSQHTSYAPIHGDQNETLFDLSPIPSILDSQQPESSLSAPRRQRLLKMITQDFRDERHASVTRHRQAVLAGNHDDDSHVLSLPMLQVYISSFWLHIHGQLPMLHRPTYSPETCPDLLLIAIIALGASCLDEDHGHEITKACAELSFFLAWHARHLIYEDPDFLPPAKLWVFQALLILEIFEKMYSTRSLHERAHVHHATTLTLMRRGSSLMGRSATDFSPYENDPTRTPPGPNGSINTAGKNTPDAWWNHWISNEATRRTAFAAFIIDTTHATMFGHSAVMVAHEMRIPLPCDEALWSAKSGAEVQRLEQGLAARGLRPLSFLEGLKKTLNGAPVRTNTFGRVVIMSGLLSISWNQKMQDVRVNSTGVGKLSSWGSQLLHAFDYWKQDFDASLATSNSTYLHGWYHPHGLDLDNVFESRTVLHCLAHMAMHVDIIDCQIFAGAKRLLGRSITMHEHAAAAKRIKENWAPTARARDAAFYALRFLSEVLLPEDHSSGTTDHLNPGILYSARDDNLLNRPWVLYFAILVVWSYGYALDGPIAPPTYTLSTRENKLHDMQGFLRRVGGVKAPDDLQNIKHRNSCLGLIMLLRDMFNTTRWELLHESAALLCNCIDMLMPGIS